MRYGLPYKGSKNQIAEWVVDNLPRADVFVDLFFGGGAITHRAMLTGKYKQFIVNDIDARLPKLFLECAYGKHTIDNHPEWITREEFQAKKDTDAYIALVWSFGNNGKDYIYGADIEDFKRDYHRAVMDDDVSLLEKWGYKIRSTHKADIYDRYLEFNAQIKTQLRNDLDVLVRIESIEHISRLQRLQSLQSLQRLQSLQSLQSLQRLQSLQSLQSHGVDYQDVPIPEGALIYCDIPYKGTKCGKYQGFDNERFYEWAAKQNNIFISEYEMPDNFIPYAWTEKTILSAANTNSNKSREMIFTNRRTYDKLSDLDKARIDCNFATQISLFDLMEDNK